MSMRDPSYLLRGNVDWSAKQAGRHRQPVEDVVARVPDDLVDRTNILAFRIDDLPAGLDDEPGDRVARTHRIERAVVIPSVLPAARPVPVSRSAAYPRGRGGSQLRL